VASFSCHVPVRVSSDLSHRSMAAVASPEELEAVLGALLVPNNDGIKRAEARLKELTKSPLFLVTMTERAGASPSPQVGF
jgi:hypothetical protein